MKRWKTRGLFAVLAVGLSAAALAYQAQYPAPAPTIDLRPATVRASSAPALLQAPSDAGLRDFSPRQLQAFGQLRQRLPNAKVALDRITGSPRLVTAGVSGYLTGPGGRGAAISQSTLDTFPSQDPYRVVKAFVAEHSDLFGHDYAALEEAVVRSDYVDRHNGVRTIVWQQRFNDIPVFSAQFKGHLTARNELVRLSSQFVSNPMLAAANGARNWADILANPPISAAEAVVLAAQAGNINVRIIPSVVVAEGACEGAERVQHFRAPGLKGKARVELSWLPLDRENMRLCWRVFLVSGKSKEAFRVFVDALTGQVWFSQNMTFYQAAPAISMSVFTSDSPSPFTPGWPTPNSAQPPLVPRTHLTNFTALNTVASPAGWVYPATNGVYVTAGNNVHAATDVDDDDVADLPRPSVPETDPDFTFPLDLNMPPLTYTNSSVVNLFYLNNFMHDRMYAYGFTEAAGNFQDNNFGRGGFGGDPVIADAQDGARINDPFYRNNAYFVPTQDGVPGHMAMFIWDGPRPDRDGSLDAEIVCHEYTHGVSTRLVGGGDILFWEHQPNGLGEGWSDIVPLCLLSEASDDPNAVYPVAGYSSYMYDDLTENYYFGIRRYPYSTDMTKNPLTLKDIDPDLADPHLGVPINPVFMAYNDPTEVHNMGEVWCIALWEVRANLVDSLGWDEGNSTMLQLIVDGMKLCPPNPTYLEARDAIVQADEMTFGGLNKAEIWRGFAKRGMGYSAKVPPANTTRGVVEAFDLPPDVTIAPPDGILEIYFTPSDGSTVMGGSVTPVYVRVRDGVSVTNATVKGVINGVTPVTFNNAGTPPDARRNDSIYSANVSVPSTGTNLTLTVTVTAPGKLDATNTVTYYVAFRPPNDLFANASKVRAEGAVLTSNNRFADAALEPGEPNHAGAPLVTSSLWWSWTAQADGPVLVDTSGSKFNTLLAVYTGSSVSALKQVASAQTQPGGRKGYVIFNAKKGEAYKIAIASVGTNYSGAITLAVLPNGTPDLTPPVVSVAKPVSGIIVQENTVDLVASAFDPGPISSGVDKINVQVLPITYRNGLVSFAPGQTSTTNKLALIPGYNTVKVYATDLAGNASEEVTLTVTYRRNPVPNDHFSFAAFLTANSGTVTADTAEATREPGEPRHADNDGGHSVWYKFKAPENGAILLSTEGSDFDTLIGLYQGDRVDSLTKVGANDDAFEGSAFSKLQQGVRSNQLYYIAVDGFNGATGKVQLAWSFTPAELYTITLSGTPGGRIKEHDFGVVDVVAGSAQVLTAVPDSGFEFVRWEGSYETSENPVSVLAKTNLAVHAVFRAVAYSDDFESGNLSKLAWSTSGAAGWYVTNTTASAGSYAARSGAISHGQSSSLKLTGKVVAGRVEFDARVSSEAGWDVFEFYMDGATVPLLRLSGDVGWTRYSYPVSDGTHTFEWRYTKDNQNSVGLDAAFIDNVNIPLVPPVDPTAPARLVLKKTPQGTCELQLTGQPDQVYVILRVLELPANTRPNWVPVSTNRAVEGQIRLFFDPANSGAQQGFYRAVTR